MPGCDAWNSKSRIGSVLKKIDGIVQYEIKGHDILIITFNDEKTTLGIITNELKKGKLVVTGEPIYIK